MSYSKRISSVLSTEEQRCPQPGAERKGPPHRKSGPMPAGRAGGGHVWARYHLGGVVAGAARAPTSAANTRVRSRRRSARGELRSSPGTERPPRTRSGPRREPAQAERLKRTNGGRAERSTADLRFVKTLMNQDGFYNFTNIMIRSTERQATIEWLDSLPVPKHKFIKLCVDTQVEGADGRRRAAARHPPCRILHATHTQIHQALC